MALAGGIGLAIVLAQSSPHPEHPIATGPVSSVQAVEATSETRDAAGNTWAPDRFATGGHLVARDVPISHTEAPELYRGERVGIRSIDVPLRSNGSYLVVLYFAEEMGASSGDRVFDVVTEGRHVATVDIARDVGPLTPYHLAFTTDVSRHRLVIRFLADTGQPVLSALKVQAVDSRIKLPADRKAWADEFQGAVGISPDGTRWAFNVGSGWGQSAHYTAAPANASLDGQGHLILAARRDASAGTVGSTPRVTSARITTQGRFEMRYGTVSARVRVAGQPGVVSAFWALGSDVDQVNWPRAGEIDPLEVRGVQPGVLVEALHMPGARGESREVWERAAAVPFASAFHTCTVERAPGVVVYEVDGRQTASLTAADVSRGSWVFDKPFSLILNLSVGGWAGQPTAATQWPVTMSVDWVRVFE